MQNHSGRTFGRITLSEPVPGKPGYWKGFCLCGNPVEKRIDNLKRPGDHSCGKCPTPSLSIDTNLAERVRRLEQFITSINPDFHSRLTSVSVAPPTPTGAGEAIEVASETRISRFSGVNFDPDGELWEARSLFGRAFFWGTTEEEAAYAARLCLEQFHATFNHRLITDAELTLTEDRREEIRFEVSEGFERCARRFKPCGHAF